VDDATKFIRIFGDHQGRATYAGRLHIRDAGFIADLKARVSGLAAGDNRARDSGWLIDFSPTQTDDLTERSLFHATLTSASEGERHLAFRIGRDWVEMGDGAMESSVRNSASNVDRALQSAFRRVVLRPRPGATEPATVGMAHA
jgi:hypothetical protein